MQTNLFDIFLTFLCQHLNNLLYKYIIFNNLFYFEKKTIYH